MRTVASCNQKGGAARTTTAVNLGHGLAVKGKRVLLVDCDPQGRSRRFSDCARKAGSLTCW